MISWLLAFHVLGIALWTGGLLAAANNLGCPLNQQGQCVGLSDGN